MKRIKNFFEGIKAWFIVNSDYIVAAISSFLQGMIKGFAIVGAVATVGYWLGHPEWVMSDKFCKMIVKNYKK
mgnify:CR=1 FL=1